MEELPIKYVKDKNGRFIPITSPKAVIDENGKSIDELFVSYENGAEVEPVINELLEKIYPVGSIYMSMNNVSPQSFLGGTWERIQDRFLLGAGSSYSAGITGGEATHILTIDEMPSHDHVEQMITDDGNPNPLVSPTTGGDQRGGKQTAKTAWTTVSERTVYTKKTGGGQPHNNMPPYLAVYMFRRVA